MPLQSTTDTHLPPVVLDVSAEMLDYLPHALGVLALDGTIRAVNRAALKLLNFHSSEVIGRHFSYFLRSLDPPLLVGGFQTLLDLGGAIFDIALLSGGERFVQVEIRLVVLFDEQAQPSSVLVLSSEGDAEHFLLRQAVAKVADQVSRMIAYDSASESLWPKLFALCHELFETPGGWLLLHDEHKRQRIPFLFGPLQGQFDKPRNGVTIHNCPCTKQGEGEPCAANSMDCPWLVSDPDSAGAEPLPRHHAVAPILSATGERVADVCLLAPADRIFHRHELSLMDAFSDQIGQALDRGEIHLSDRLGTLDRFSLLDRDHLAAELRLDKRNLELLYQLSQSLVATLEPQAVADKALELVTAVFDDCFGEIYVVESGEEFLQLLAVRNYPPGAVAKLPRQPYLRPGVGVEGMAIEMRRPVLIPDVADDPRWMHIPGLDLVLRSAAAIPLIARNELVGVISLSSPEYDAFPHRSLPLLQSIAAPVALALQNARLFVAERQRRQEAEMLRIASGAVTLDLRLEQILRLLLERLRQVVHFDSACVLLLEGKELHALAEIGLPRPDEVLGQRFPVADSFFARIQRERQALFFDDVQKLSGFFGWGGTSNIHGWMGVPLIQRGEVLGYITLDSRQVGSYGEREASLAQAFANQMAITLVNAQLLQDSQQAAFEQQEISAILRGLNGAASLAEIHTVVATGVQRLIGSAAIEIALYQADEQRVSAARSLWAAGASNATTSALSYRFDESAALVSLLQGQSHISADVSAESRWPIEAAWAAQGYRSHLALPLQGSAHVLGHIQLLWRDQLAPAQTIHFSLRQITDGVAMAVEKLTLLEQATRRAGELQMLIQLSGQLRTTEGRTQITQIALATCLDVLHADRGYVLVPAADDQVLEVVAQMGKGAIAPARRYGYGDSIAGHVFCSGLSHCSPNLFDDPLGHQPTLQSWAASGLTFVSALYAPLRAGERIVGVLSVTNTETRRSFTQADLRLLNAIAEIAGGALHRATILEGLEQRVAERTADLAQANVRLLELDRMKSDFVANVSHELRTPLTNIKLYLDLLSEGRPERRQRYLQVAHQEADQLHRLIESILDLSALDESRTKMVADFETLLLNEVVERSFSRFRQQASGAGVDFVYLPPPQPLAVWGHREHLLQLCANLISNAISYTRRGGKVEITLDKNAADEVGIVVRDSGIGIDADEITHIFERFYRSERVKQSAILGTGLGLSIVNEVVQAHGGRIAVESVLNEGTVFTVWLPSKAANQHKLLEDD